MMTEMMEGEAALAKPGLVCGQRRNKGTNTRETRASPANVVPICRLNELQLIKVVSAEATVQKGNHRLCKENRPRVTRLCSTLPEIKRANQM